MNTTNKMTKTKTKDTSKYSNLVKNNKISIPLPNLDKLKAAVEKDIDKIDKKIESWQSKIDLKNITDVGKCREYIGQAADFAIIKNRLEKTVKDFPTIVKEIKRIWTEPMKPMFKDSEDELRVAAPFYSINFENGWQDFDEVGSDSASKCDVFTFVQKTMKNTLEYLGKFGCLVCNAGCDCEVLETNSFHPWFNEIEQDY